LERHNARDAMVRMSNYAALLVFAFLCAFWPGSPSRAEEGCDFVTTAELESAFDIPFIDNSSQKHGNVTYCEYVGKDGPGLVIITNSPLPPGSELVALRAQRKANAEKDCQHGMLGSAPRTPGTFEVVPDVGDEAYACSWLIVKSHNIKVGGATMLYVAQGPNVFQVTVMVRKPGLLQAMVVLARSALTRLPR